MLSDMAQMVSLLQDVAQSVSIHSLIKFEQNLTPHSEICLYLMQTARKGVLWHMQATIVQFSMHICSLIGP